MSFLLGFLFFVAAQGFIWVQNNAQFVWEWWADRPLVASLSMGVPASLCFWYGSRLIVEQTGELWAARFLGFGASYLIFPFLTYYLANESMFTTKTLICTALSFVIIFIQVFWK